MSTVSFIPGELLVELSPTEKIAGLRGDVRIPLTAIADVEVVPDALAAARGLRAPGLALPGVRKVGTWRTRAGAEFVLARRGEAGVRLTLTGHDLAAVLLGDDDAEGLAARIRAAR
ncbi:MAG: hypothetical protein ABWY29_07005 [Blastococcus sp.]